MGFFNIFRRNKKRVDKEAGQEPYRLSQGTGPSGGLPQEPTRPVDERVSSEAQPPQTAAPPARGSNHILRVVQAQTPEARRAAWRDLEHEIALARIEAMGDLTVITPPGRQSTLFDGSLFPQPGPGLRRSNAVRRGRDGPPRAPTNSLQGRARWLLTG